MVRINSNQYCDLVSSNDTDISNLQSEDSSLWSAITATNTAIRSITTANATEIGDVWTGLKSTNTAIRSLVTSNDSDISSLQTEDSNLWSAITATNTAIRSLVSSNDNDIDAINTNLDQKLGATSSVTLTGAVTGSASFSANAVSITTTATSDPTLTLSGDVSGSATFTNLGNATLTATVADDSHNHSSSSGAFTVGGDLTVSGGDITLSGTGRIQGIDTVSAGTDAASKTYVDTAVAGVVDSAPAALDTLNELAAALNDDANAFTTLNTNISQKLGATASVTLTGDVSGSGSFSSNAVSISVTVADDSHNHVLSNIDGITATVAELNIMDGVTASTAEINKLDGVTATTTELNYVDGVTSAIQTQIDEKQDTLTGGATTIASSDLTTNRALISNGSGKVGVSAVTSTELGYLDGVTSAIQTQIDSKQATVNGGASTITSSNLGASRALISNGSGKVAVSAVTSTELGYLDGVTSAIQTQLNAKQASGSYAVTTNNLSDLSSASTARTNLGLGSLATLSAVGASQITDNTVGAAELNVSGNGSTSQFLRSDGDGSFSWATPTDTNTTYTGGSGITLSSTTFNLDSDVRGDMWTMGRDTNDYFTVGTTTQSWYLDGAEDMRLTNNGNLDVEGNVVAHSSTVSDRNLKDNIEKIEGALDMVKALNGYTFTYKKDGRLGAGLIAQEVQEVLPRAVTEHEILNTEGSHLILEYDQIHGILVEAIKEQQAQIEELKNIINSK